MRGTPIRSLAVIAAALCLIGAAMTAALVSRSDSTVRAAVRSAEPDQRGAEKGEVPGGRADGVSKFEQEYSARAYPAAEIPLSGSIAARQTWSRIVADTAATRAGAKSSPSGVIGTPGVWELYGPKDTALYPATVSSTGSPYETSGRVTAMAISRTCDGSNCHLFVAAAGGGIWRSDNPTAATPQWRNVSDGYFDTNAIGAMMMDPNDPTGRTLYVGTGEPNSSGDSESGTGIYRTGNGGDTWTKVAGAQAGGPACGDPDLTVCVPGASAFLGRSVGNLAIQPGNPSHIIVTTTRGVRGVSSTGGAVSSNTAYPPVGLWESTDGGQTFSYVWNANLSVRGATDLEFDPQNSTDVYASAYQQGLWRRSPGLDGDANFHQVFAPINPEFNTDRVEFDLVGLANGKTRIYLTDGARGPDAGAQPASFWRTDNGNQASSSLLASQGPGSTAPAGNGNPYPAVYNGWQKLTSTAFASPYWATNNFCTGQCWYDELVTSPPGRPDDVYVQGSYLYAEQPCITKGNGCGTGVSDSRAVLYSNTAGDPDPAANNRTFTDLTLDAQNVPFNGCEHPLSTCIWAPHWTHPDQHAIVVNPNNPRQIFGGGDGGVNRSNGQYVNIARSCSFRPGLSADQMTACQRVTSRVPAELQPVNRGLQTLQFQSFSFNPQNPCDFMGGTQDNGTFEAKGCNDATWPEIIDGDGGQSGFDVGNPANRFNQFNSGFGAVNFDNGSPTEFDWYFDLGPVLNTETSLFYWPQIADPVVGGTMYDGAAHVWRTFDWGGGKAFLSDPAKNCQSVTTNGEAVCGDWVPMGGPPGANSAGSLVGTSFGDRAGGNVTQVQRTRVDTGTIWASTTAGRLFITRNARCGTATDASCVVWTRLDSLVTNDPGRYITGIYPDPTNPNRAWISYNGYNATTPTTPGHVFQVDTNAVGTTATFTNLNVEAGTAIYPNPGSGDLPVLDVVRDDASGALYAATDFGVLGNPTGAAGNWSVAGSSLPSVEVSSLTVVPGRNGCTANCGRVLIAATHGRSAWVMRLP